MLRLIWSFSSLAKAQTPSENKTDHLVSVATNSGELFEKTRK